MEEYVGELWHKLVTKVASTNHPEAAVYLEDIAKSASIFFRALGGDVGLSTSAVQATLQGGRRNWKQRLSGSHLRVELAWKDAETLRLPASIDIFPEKNHNRDLYFWLMALLANDVAPEADWILRNQRATIATLNQFPGLKSRYEKLVRATINLRPSVDKAPTDEAAQELAIRQALLHPGSVSALPLSKRAHSPVLMWLHPSPDISQNMSALSQSSAPERESSESQKMVKDRKKRAAERKDAPDGKDGFLMMFRAESIFSWSEYIHVNRPQDEEDDVENAQRAAEDMDVITVTRDGETNAAKLRFDLDLPSTGEDDVSAGEGVPLPEWDYKKGVMHNDYCYLQELVTPNVENRPLPSALKEAARRIKNQFQALAPNRIWLRGMPDGSELDLDAWVRHTTDLKIGTHSDEKGLYRTQIKNHRDLACLLLADLSLSTDAYASDKARVIDVIRDSLFLFAEALSATKDSFAMYGFSSLKRENIRFHRIKSFEESYNGDTRGRINAIKPGYYTRMGAAIRQASMLLAQQNRKQRVLLLLTDGKPNDLDRYEGRYGVEDTRKAIIEARQMGLHPFCVTIDNEENDYLSHIFGVGAYAVIRKADDLPKQLPAMYAQITNI